MAEEGATPAEPQDDVRVFGVVTTRDGMATAEGMTNLLSAPGPGVVLTAAVAAHVWPVDFMRNDAVRQALEHEWDYLWFIDDDIITPQKTAQLVRHGKDIIAAPYFALQWENKTPALRWTVQDYDEEGNLVDGPLGNEFRRIGACGMGCTFIHRRVFEAIEPPWFEYRCVYGEDKWERKGEDFDFCHKAVAAGFEIWCEPRLVCSHCKLIDLKVVADLVQLQLGKQAEYYEKQIEELEAELCLA